MSLGVLLACAVATVVVLLASRDPYAIHAHFVSASRLVPGAQVEVAGRPVGKVSRIGLTPDGQADVTLSIDDDSVVPLHAGTRAAIRAFSAAGVTSNVVVLTPAPDGARSMSSGAVLPTTQTTSSVDIDALLDSFGPKERANLSALIRRSADVYAGSGSRYFNSMLAKLDPALGALDGATSELVADGPLLGQIVKKGSDAAGAIASRRPDLEASIAYTERALGAVATRRRELSGLISGLPETLGQGRGTLAQASGAVTALRPALRDVLPAADPLHDALVDTNAALRPAGRTAGQLRRQLPSLNRALTGLRPLQRPTVRALETLGPMADALRPIAEGLRYYGVDLIVGSLAGLFGSVSSEYDKYGHYAKLNYVQSGQLLLGGPLSEALTANPLIPGLLAVRTGLTRRCPGGTQPPAPDGSSPLKLDAKWCTASDNVPASVNTP